MISQEPSSVIRMSLPCKIREKASKSLWWVEDNYPSEQLNSIAQRIQQPDTIHVEHHLKSTRRRLVFKIFDMNEQPQVVKAFPLENIRHRYFYKKYAYTEAENLILAQAAGITVPKIHGYGEYRNWGLVQWSAVVMEYIAGKTLDEKLSEKKSEEARVQLLKSVYELMKQLYLAGCFHMDCRVDGIHCTETEKGSNTLIDFQYAHFTKAPSEEAMALNAGIFAFSVSGWRKWVSPAAMEAWFEGLLEHLDVKATDTLWKSFQKLHKRRWGTSEKLVMASQL